MLLKLKTSVSFPLCVRTCQVEGNSCTHLNQNCANAVNSLAQFWGQGNHSYLVSIASDTTDLASLLLSHTVEINFHKLTQTDMLIICCYNMDTQSVSVSVWMNFVKSIITKESVWNTVRRLVKTKIRLKK